MEAENLNMNNEMMLKSKSNESQRDEDDYREWLLKPREQDNNSEETNKSIQRSGSFELLDLEKGTFYSHNRFELIINNLMIITP